MIKSILLIMLAMPATCFALGESEAYKCSNGIVSPGDSKSEVLEKCGEPTLRTSTGRIFKYAGKTYRPTENWIYDPGPNEFINWVNFNGDRVSILYNTGDYGKAKTKSGKSFF